MGTNLSSTFETVMNMVNETRFSQKDEVLFTCSYFPRELPEAFGLMTSRLSAFGSQLDESEGQKRLGPEACSYCKAIAGGVKLSPPQVLFGCTTCDQMRRLVEEIGRSTGCYFDYVNIPATRSKSALEHYQREIFLLLDKLQVLTHKDLDSSKLEKIVFLRNRVRQKIKELKPRLASYEFTALINLEMHLSPQEMLDFFETYHPNKPFKTYKTRLMLAGSPLTLKDIDFLVMLDELGIDLVADATCTGDRWIGFEVVLDGSPVTSLAKSYFERPGCIWLRPNNEFYQYAYNLAKNTSAKGVIWRSVKFCDLWSLESQRAKELLGLPLVSLDMNYSDTTSIRIQTRLEAFLEGIA